MSLVVELVDAGESRLFAESGLQSRFVLPGLMLPDTTKSAIIERIKATTVEAAVAVTDEADLYEDLGIYGDDFDYVVVWISETFGTDFSSMKAEFAPGEAGEFGIRRLIQGKSRYQRCTVGDLLKAVERGRWGD